MQISKGFRYVLNHTQAASRRFSSNAPQLLGKKIKNALFVGSGNISKGYFGPKFHQNNIQNTFLTQNGADELLKQGGYYFDEPDQGIQLLPADVIRSVDELSFKPDCVWLVGKLENTDQELEIAKDLRDKFPKLPIILGKNGVQNKKQKEQIKASDIDLAVFKNGATTSIDADGRRITALPIPGSMTTTSEPMAKALQQMGFQCDYQESQQFAEEQLIKLLFRNINNMLVLMRVANLFDQGKKITNRDWQYGPVIQDNLIQGTAKNLIETVLYPYYESVFSNPTFNLNDALNSQADYCKNLDTHTPTTAGVFQRRARGSNERPEDLYAAIQKELLSVSPNSYPLQKLISISQCDENGLNMFDNIAAVTDWDA